MPRGLDTAVWASSLATPRDGEGVEAVGHHHLVADERVLRLEDEPVVHRQRLALVAVLDRQETGRPRRVLDVSSTWATVGIGSTSVGATVRSFSTASMASVPSDSR